VTTSPQTEDLNHPVLRRLVEEANRLALSDRVTLLKALIPSVARDMAPRDFAGLAAELRLKGERMHDALAHRGTGRAGRHVPGERDIERR
jgi:hypothetical protein